MTNDVQYYDHNSERLVHEWRHKIEKILAHDCIKKITPDLYHCEPIKGYNTRTYKLERQQSGFKCNCQGWGKRNDCSHVQALYVKMIRREHG